MTLTPVEDSEAVTLMDRVMQRDILRQGDVLSQLLTREAEFRRAGVALRPEARGKLFSFGSGDGWFASRAAETYARQVLRLPYQPASSLEMLAYHAPDMSGSDRAVAISMSGSADRTNEAADRITAQDTKVLALTNGGGGTLATIAGHKISLDVADLAPFLTGTTKYTASLLGLLLLMQGAADRVEPELTQIVAQIPALLSHVAPVARDFAQSLKAAPPTGIRILSAGCNMATADYGTAKFLKLVSLPVTADEVEEFAHRQFWSVPASDVVIYVVANQAVARCAAASAAALRSMGMRTLVIDTPATPVTTASARMTLPAVSEALSPLPAAIPLQMLAYEIARALGGNPDISQEIGDPARFHAAQLLSRRGELA